VAARIAEFDRTFRTIRPDPRNPQRREQGYTGIFHRISMAAVDIGDLKNF